MLDLLSDLTFLEMIFALVGVLLGVAKAAVDIHIVAGTDAEITSFPFMAAIFHYNKAKLKTDLICSGSLISPTAVLSAAHCFSLGLREMDLSVVVGEADIYVENAMHVGVTGIFIHENHSRQVPYDDISIIQLQYDVVYSPQIQTISLPNFGDLRTSYVGQEVAIAGWGTLKYNGGPAKSLQMTTQKVISSKACESVFKKLLARNYLRNLPRGISGGIICASDTTPKRSDACMRDSGGPMVLNNKLIGIIVSGVKCGEGNPGIYTRVSYYLNWIEATLKLIR